LADLTLGTLNMQARWVPADISFEAPDISYIDCLGKIGKQARNQTQPRAMCDWQHPE
jgi:hypothetical protein